VVEEFKKSIAEIRVIFRHLARNRLTGKIPQELGQCSQLKHLYLSNNRLSGEIPTSLGSCTKLVHLYLFSNGLTGEIPNSIGFLSELRYLDLTNNRLSGCIPESLTNCTQLQYLYLSRNQLTGEIPSTIDRCTELGALDLSYNQLSGSIPASLGKCSKLARVNLAHNNLTGEIPSSLVQCYILTNLIVSDTLVQGKIPQSLFKKMETSEISPLFYACEKGNVDAVKQLLDLPSAQQTLSMVSNSGHSLLEVAATSSNRNAIILLLLQKGMNATCGDGKPFLQWCYENGLFGVMASLTKSIKDLSNDPWVEKISNSHCIRTILLGAPEAGKTTLVSAIKNYTEKNYLDKKININLNTATDGIETTRIRDVDFWDFGGQQILWSTHEFFLTPKTPYILVVDLAKFTSSDETARKQCERDTLYWMNLIGPLTNSLGDFPVILVGTHIDVLNAKISRKHATGLLLKFAREHQLNCHEKVFCYSPTRSGRGIWKQIKQISKHAKISSSRPQFSYSALRLKLETLRSQQSRPYIWWNEFVQICKLDFDMEENEMHAVAEYLINCGSIVTYRHASSGGFSLVVLDPYWLATAFTSIVSISIQGSSNRRGIFTRETLENRWSEPQFNFPRKTWPQLEQLFALFQLMVKLPNGTYFIPAMNFAPKHHVLATEEQQQNFASRISEWSECYAREYTFSQLVLGLATRLLVRILHYPGMNIDMSFCSDNVYVLFHLDFVVRMEFLFVENKLRIECYSKPNCSLSELGFFCHFVFEAPEELIRSFGILCTIDEDAKVFYQKKLIGQENSIRQRFLQGETLPSGSPDLVLAGIHLLDGSLAIVNHRIGKSNYIVSWSGSFDGSPVMFKEIRGSTLRAQRNFIREVWMSYHLHKSSHVIRFLGVCLKSQSLRTSANTLLNDEIGTAAPVQMPNISMLTVFESAPHGDLTSCHAQVKSASLGLKVKLAYDVAKGLLDVHKSEIPFVHRDVQSKNVFVFSLDETSALEQHVVHAKLGELGSSVFISPFCGEELGNWQYMAPEAMQGAVTVGYSAQIDVYSFGMVLWEIFSGETPFHEYLSSEDDRGRMKVLAGDRPDIPVDVPESISNLIAACWDADANSRPSLDFVVNSLQDVLRDLRLTTTPR